jgi:hypothetical protein
MSRRPLREAFPDWKPPTWLVLDNELRWRDSPDRRLFVARVDPEAETFHVREPGREKWLRFGFHEVYQFEPVPARFDRPEAL